jgi:hypothetical protein
MTKLFISTLSLILTMVSVDFQTPNYEVWPIKICFSFEGKPSIVSCIDAPEKEKG